jgi:hypothetical protein
MITKLPSAAELRTALAPMNYAQLQRLADLSDVPFHTLRKVRDGETANPSLETARKFAPHIKASLKHVVR